MNSEDNGVIYTVSYVIQSSIKRAMVYKILEGRSQTFSSLKVIVKPDNSKNMLANNKSNSHKKAISTKFSLDMESNILITYFPETIREVSCKYQQSIDKPSTAKK